jgi:flagellin-like protein
MSYTHRGLSDVVTTVLIILLVVVAVVAIGAYVRTSVDQSGRTVEREGTCLANSVVVASCKNTSATAVTVALRRSSDDSIVASTGNYNAIFKRSNGNFETKALVATLSSNAAVSSATSVTVTDAPVEASVTTEFTLKNGNKVTCTSPVVPCSSA